ncbi:MAG: hypothetical protein LBN96_00625 [Desulfovibrio sp.]|jgi:hypothetical protein|nr:hypothetical protein [Desulfovibrio sp.]
MLRLFFSAPARKYCVVFCLSFLAPAYAAATTRVGDASLAAQCPAQIGKAIDDANVAAFEKLVDINAILDAALNIFLRDLDAMQAAGELPPMLALLFSGAAMRDAAGAQVRNLLINETRAFVLNGVDSGAFAGRPPGGRAARGLLAPLFAEASTGRKEIRDIGVPVPEGGDWIIPFVVHDFGNGESYPVLGRVSPAKNGFRLTGVENLEEIMRRVNEERKQQEEEGSDPQQLHSSGHGGVFAGFLLAGERGPGLVGRRRAGLL